MSRGEHLVTQGKKSNLYEFCVNPEMVGFRDPCHAFADTYIHKSISVGIDKSIPKVYVYIRLGHTQRSFLHIPNYQILLICQRYALGSIKQIGVLFLYYITMTSLKKCFERTTVQYGKAHDNHVEERCRLKFSDKCFQSSTVEKTLHCS